MSSDNAGQVLIPIQEPLRSAAVLHSEASLLAFQLLVWAELSKQRALDGLSLESALQLGAVGLVESLQRLVVQEGAIGQAFNGAPRNARASGDYIVQAAAAAKRLVEGGIFERFSPVEIASDQLSPSYHSLGLPRELAVLMVDLVVEENAKRIYCPWEGSGQLIGSLIEHTGTVYVEGNRHEALPALIGLLRSAPTVLEAADPLRNPTAIKGGRLETFEACLSFPPMGMQLSEEIANQDIYNRFPVKKATSTGLMLQHILASTRGKAAVIVPNSFVFGPGKDREVREHLLRSGVVEAVIALPAGIHQTTNVLTALLILNPARPTDKVGLLDANLSHFRSQPPKGKVTLQNVGDIRSFCASLVDAGESSGSRLDASLARVVGTDEILKNDASLQVSRYVMAPEQRELQERMASLQTVTLNEVAEFIQPVPNKDRGSDASTAMNAYEVGAADIPAYGYIRQAEKPVKISLSARKSGNANDVFLRPLDLVLIVKGSVGKIGIVPENVPPPGDGGWIAGQSAIVLRGKDPGFDMRGLGLWLRSEMGQKQLEGIRSGAAIPMISIATLRRLQIYAGVRILAESAAQIIEQEHEIQLQIEGLQMDQADVSTDYWAAIYAELGKNSSSTK